MLILKEPMLNLFCSINLSSLENLQLYCFYLVILMSKEELVMDESYNLIILELVLVLVFIHMVINFTIMTIIIRKRIFIIIIILFIIIIIYIILIIILIIMIIILIIIIIIIIFIILLISIPILNYLSQLMVNIMEELIIIIFL